MSFATAPLAVASASCACSFSTFLSSCCFAQRLRRGGGIRFHLFIEIKPIFAHSVGRGAASLRRRQIGIAADATVPTSSPWVQGKREAADCRLFTSKQTSLTCKNEISRRESNIDEILTALGGRGAPSIHNTKRARVEIQKKKRTFLPLAPPDRRHGHRHDGALAADGV